MSAKSTWFWLVTAAALFAIIYFFPPKTKHAPDLILPSFQPAAVDSIQVLPSGHQLEIRAVRTNATWELTRPISYPAQSDAIENLLAAFQNLLPASRINEAELTNPFTADEEFGFSDPQFTLIFKQGEAFIRLRIGKLTPPGDQVFLQVVGVEGVIYVVESDILKLIPRSADNWRDTALLNLQNLAFDRIAVTNGAKAFVLQRDSTSLPWAMVYPIPARADNAKIASALDQLRDLRITRFISDEPKTEAETLGLQPPDLELCLAQGTNTVTWLQFGKSLTNDAHQLYARRVGLNSIVTVPKDPLTAWRFSSVNEFRAPHLITLTSSVDSVEVCADERFSLELQADGQWRVLPENSPADTAVVTDFISHLAGVQIIDFIKDLVPEKALPNYGLGSPARQFSLRFSASNSVAADPITPSSPATSAESAPAPSSNGVPVELNFGSTNTEGRVFVRRSDETSVYAVNAEDLSHLPSASWQFRERKLWHFTEDEIASVVIRQDGRERELVRKGQYQWSLGAHSQGMIEPLPIEETVRDLINASAGTWVPPGQGVRERCGLTNHLRQFTFVLKNGDTASLELGGTDPNGLPFGAVPREDAQTWIFQFPDAKTSASLCRDVINFLSPQP